jgi:paraquat-inducible protein B
MSKNDEYISDFSAAPNTENQLRIIKEVLESDLRKEDKEKILSGFAKQIREDQADINEAFRDSTRERMQQLTQGIQGIIDANPDFTSTLNELSQVAAPQQRVGKKSEADELEAFFADDDQQAEVASRSV